jgi:hypothetical protein
MLWEFKAMPFWLNKEERVYSDIAAVLKDDGIASILQESSGLRITDVAGTNDPPLSKFKRSMEFLKRYDSERWLLIYVLAKVAGPEAQKVVDAFPDTLTNLPPVDDSVSSALNFLERMELFPLSPGLKDSLRLQRTRFAEIAGRIVTLFVYKSLHNLFLDLLSCVSLAEALLAHPVPDVPPNFVAVANKVDEVVLKGRQDLERLGVDAADVKTGIDTRLGELAALSDSLRKAANPIGASVDLNDIHLSARETLSQLNENVFAAANELSFDPWRYELPDKIQLSDEFKEFDQLIRDLTATIRARAFKHKLWLEAEAKLASMGHSFDARKAAAEVIEPWIVLRQSVEWLAKLEGETWEKDAKKYAEGINKEIDKGNELTEEIKPYFDAYQSWFREPFSRIERGLTADCDSVYRMDAPFSTIWKDLGR